MSNKIALGTVQFGMDYGVSGGVQVKQEEVRKILELASQKGVDTLDTAIAYGESEKVLGFSDISEFNVITKLPRIPEKLNNTHDWVVQSINESIQRLNISSLYGVLLHRPADLFLEHGKDIYSGLLELKEKGIIQKTGISIYSPDELEAIMGNYPVEIVQAPYNVFDQRLESSGWMEKLHIGGVEIHARSVFLQGLLLMSQRELPEKFHRWNDVWHVWYSWLEENRIPAMTVCVNYVNQNPMIDKMVIGVDNSNQLNEILCCEASAIQVLPDALSHISNELISPSSWNDL